MVQCIEPTWEVREATTATEGAHIAYHLAIGTEDGERRCVLKATPPSLSPVCGDEARVLAVLDAHTTLPVPEVIGCVDDHDGLPTPFFLAAELPGANDGRTALSRFSAATVARVARSTGRHLAALHALDAVDAYGFVDVDPAESLDGGRPSAGVEQIGVADPVDSWTEYLRGEVGRVTAGLGETRFADCRSAVRPVLEACVDSLDGEFRPAVARVDHSLGNFVRDPQTDAVTGLLDWEFCVGATPAYDLAFVEHSLAGGHWALLDEAPDHRETIRTAMLEGYREAGEPGTVEQFRANRGCYALLAEVHAMLNFADFFDRFGATERERDAAADALRDRVIDSI